MNDGPSDSIMDILKGMSETKLASGDRFEGACTYSGAQRTAIVKHRAEHLSIFANVKVESSMSKRACRFENIFHECCGEIPIHLTVNSNFLALFQVKLVPVDSSFLLDLDLLTKFKIVIDFENDVKFKRGCMVATNHTNPGQCLYGMTSKNILHRSWATSHTSTFLPFPNRSSYRTFWACWPKLWAIKNRVDLD